MLGLCSSVLASGVQESCPKGQVKVLASLAELKHPPVGETALSVVVTPRGKLERTNVSSDSFNLRSWVKNHPKLANELGLYLTEKGQLWMPDEGEYNFRVRRYLARKGYEPQIKHLAVPKYASSEEYVNILTQRGFPYALDHSFRQHDFEHGMSIILISSTPHGRLILDAGYRRLEALMDLHQKLVKLWPKLEKDLDTFFYGPHVGGPEDWGVFLVGDTGYIERGTFGISEILFEHRVGISKGNTLRERVKRTFDVFANAADHSIFDMDTFESTEVPWTARSKLVGFRQSVLGRKLTDEQRVVVAGLLDEIDERLKPVDDKVLDAATDEMVQVLNDLGYK